jgi:hypothetical protein
MVYPAEYKMKKIYLIIIGITAITILETIALLKNIDGQLFSIVIGSISALIGYAFGITKK